MQIEETPKPELAPVPIWRCTGDGCKAWVREELNASGANPDCPLCKGRMIRGIKHLPKLVKKVSSPRKKKDDTLLH
ncbi:cold-shock protein [Paenibacillus sp. TRM 82003]|nr:cold-shock protein [Paenibacillus sp. TRM 82003]